MKDKVKAALAGLSPGSALVCAVSGGADSVALLHCLRTLSEELGFSLTAAHFNHCLRGEESDGDEAFVRYLCKQWGVPLAVGRGDAAKRARETGESLEEAARALRHGFLSAQPGLIATAHNADDQVETVLINLLRGTGLRGLCGMAPQSGRIVRPLLTVTRAEILAYLQIKRPHLAGGQQQWRRRCPQKPPAPPCDSPIKAGKSQLGGHCGAIHGHFAPGRGASGGRDGGAPS